MQLVVETLVCSLPAVGNVIAFGAFLFAIFAILGVQLFAGRMGMCNQVSTHIGVHPCVRVHNLRCPTHARRHCGMCDHAGMWCSQWW